MPKVAPVLPADLPDRWKAVLWRQEELERAGYPLSDAMAIAERVDVDLHDACDLVVRGATPKQALDILL
jgi:hypothetical protein